MLTEDMTRLSSEIGGLRRQRASLIQQLVDGKRQRQEFISEFRSNIQCDSKAVTDALRKKRTTVLDHLRQHVSSVRQEMKNDLTGVRKAWAGRA
jgi:hypothetical protein